MKIIETNITKEEDMDSKEIRPKIGFIKVVVPVTVNLIMNFSVVAGFVAGIKGLVYFSQFLENIFRVGFSSGLPAVIYLASLFLISASICLILIRRFSARLYYELLRTKPLVLLKYIPYAFIFGFFLLVWLYAMFGYLLDSILKRMY
jgi:hypothetical protein